MSFFFLSKPLQIYTLSLSRSRARSTLHSFRSYPFLAFLLPLLPLSSSIAATTPWTPPASYLRSLEKSADVKTRASVSGVAETSSPRASSSEASSAWWLCIRAPFGTAMRGIGPGAGEGARLPFLAPLAGGLGVDSVSKMLPAPACVTTRSAPANRSLRDGA